MILRKTVTEYKAIRGNIAIVFCEQMNMLYKQQVIRAVHKEQSLILSENKAYK